MTRDLFRRLSALETRQRQLDRAERTRVILPQRDPDPDDEGPPPTLPPLAERLAADAVLLILSAEEMADLHAGRLVIDG